MYAVIGATGHTGRIVAERLLAAGKPVRAIGRDAATLQPLVRAGALPIVGTLDDPQTLAKAFDGANVVYAMIPPDYATDDPQGHQRRIGTAIAGALRDMRVAYCVNLSSVGAQNRSGSGPVSGLGLQEDRLNAISGLNVMHLRPGYFMENLFAMLPMIKQGFIATPMHAKLAMPWIATADVGQAAADELIGLGFKGQTFRELQGPRDMSWDEAIVVLGKAIGNPALKYIEAPYDEAAKSMVATGLKPALAAEFVEMYRAMNEQRMKPQEPRTPRSTTPTTLEVFAKGVAAALA